MILDPTDAHALSKPYCPTHLCRLRRRQVPSAQGSGPG